MYATKLIVVDGDGNGDAKGNDLHCSGYGGASPCDGVPGGRGEEGDYRIRDFLHPKLHTYVPPN